MLDRLSRVAWRSVRICVAGVTIARGVELRDPYLSGSILKNDIPTSMLTDRFAQAVAFASIVHATHARKGTNIPYISHLIGVASLVLEHGADEDTAIAALLHDAPEDRG